MAGVAELEVAGVKLVIQIVRPSGPPGFLVQGLDFPRCAGGDDAVAHADVVTLHVPATVQTSRMIDAATLASQPYTMEDPHGENIVRVFYVKDVFGLKVENERKLQQLREALLAALANPDETDAPALLPRKRRRATG